MTTTAPEQDIERFLCSREQPLLRVMTCGSVDDGKSTLVGRLLYEAQVLFSDQLAALELESKQLGTRAGELDFALLVDGLSAEREQGITIDVGYRFFCTAKRKFIVADTPGHEQYTRNMVTGASTADIAVILVDARKGVLTQTRRHTYLASLLGIRKFVLAVNKMDLVQYSPEVFSRVEREYREFCLRLELDDITCIPVSAVYGDNVAARSPRMEWYAGPALLEYLEREPLPDEAVRKPFRLPVQWVNRGSDGFRGYAGTILSGAVEVGDSVRVLPSSQTSHITEIFTGDRRATRAVAGESVTVTLDADIDVSRGDVFAPPTASPSVADQFEATIVWMDEEPMLQARSYLLKLGPRTVVATVSPIKYRINVNTLEHVAAKHLNANDIAVCGLQLSEPVVFEPYRQSRELGGFILIDRISNRTVGAGLLHFALRRCC